MAVELGRFDRSERRRRPRRRALDDTTRPCGGCDNPEPSSTNAELIARCIAGEFGAWNELVSRYERLVYAIPLREGLGPEDAAEISQAAFEALVQSLTRIQKPDRVGHWLMTVTRRLTWRQVTARRAEVSVDLQTLEPSTIVEDPQWELTVDVYDAILELGDPCRALIFGLFFDPAEPSYDELAHVLGMAVGSIGPLRGRCLTRLRCVLEEGAS